MVVAAAAQRMCGHRAGKLGCPSARDRRDASRCRRPCRIAATDRAPPAASRRHGQANQPRRRPHAPARSRSPLRRRWRGCRASSRAWWSRSPPKRRRGPAPAPTPPGSAPRSWSRYGRGTRSRPRRARSSPPATTSPDAGPDIARRSAGTCRSRWRSPLPTDGPSSHSARARRPPRRGGGIRPPEPPSSAAHRRGIRPGKPAPAPRPCPSSPRGTVPRSSTRSAARGSPSRGCSRRRSPPSGACG